MGYRSEVALLLYTSDSKREPLLDLWVRANIVDVFRADEELREYFEWKGEEDNESYRLIDGDIVIQYRLIDGGIVIQFKSIKWYESHPIVKFVNGIIEQFIETFLNDPVTTEAYEFMRIGESYEDTKERAGGDTQGFLRLERSIEIDV